MKKKICATLCVVFVHFQLYAIPVGPMPVIDVPSWITAIDTLYASYDQIQNTLNQIKLQYEQLQHGYEMVKSWELDNISWDGDYDFRNEIHDFGASVNKQLSNIRAMQSSLTDQNLSLGGHRYSIADLVGAGEENKNILSFTKNTADWAKNTQMRKIADAFTGKLSENEKSWIMWKYGMSPSNYFWMRKSQNMVKKNMGKVIAMASEAGQKASAENMSKELKKAFELATNGENPVKIQQGIATMVYFLNKNINTLQSSMLEIGALYAQQLNQEQKEKEAKEAFKNATKEQSDAPASMFLGNSLGD